MFWKAFQICVITTIFLLDFLSPAHAYKLHLTQKPTTLS